jgi:hypothetical protein
MGKRVGLLAGLLVLALGSGTVAQSPSPEPPPWLGGRVEMPEHGFAITLRDGWVAVDMTADEEAQTQAVSSMFGDDFADVLPSMFAEARANHTALAFFPPGGWGAAGDWVADAAFEFCGVGSTGISEPLATSRLAAVAAALGGPSSGTPTVVGLPAGTAIAVDFPGTLDDGLAVSATAYFVANDRTLLIASCVAPDPPQDRWLSIAESVEFLPAEE